MVFFSLMPAGALSFMEEEEEVKEEGGRRLISHGRGGGWEVAEETIGFPSMM